MKRFKKLLVATDTRIDEHSVVDEAAELAAHNKAALTIVDVVPEASWIASLVAADLESMREAYTRETQDKLEALATPWRDKGLEITTRVLKGKTSVEVIREVMPLEMTDGKDYVIALANRFGEYAASARSAIDESADRNDAVTSDLFTEIAREVDKSLYFLESHLQG